MQNLSSTLLALKQNSTTSVSLLDRAFENIKVKTLQGSISFLSTFKKQAYLQAKQWDSKREDGTELPLLAGVPFSVKDNFDLQGKITTAGSKVLSTESPALRDAPFIAQLKQTGAIILGKTNMTEFAYSGLGINKHFGTPLSPIDTARIAGGSSSGGAVSVAQGMSLFAVGSDTSGSCRIPAACCGLVGYRPSKQRFSTEGIVPLADSLDVPGLLTKEVSCIQIITAAIGSAKDIDIESVPTLSTMRFLVPSEIETKTYDPIVKTHFEQFLNLLVEQGVNIIRQSFLFRQITEQANPADIVTYEAFQYHQPLLAKYQADYDPRIATRMAKAADISHNYYRNLIEQLSQLRVEADELLDKFDGILMPTLPILPPRLDELEGEDEYLRANTLIIRNTAIANHLDLPAICFPDKRAIARYYPVSIQLIGKRRQDECMLKIASVLSQLNNH